jgi:hypothetical protein
MRAPALVLESNFDTAADTDDYFTVRILDDGAPPDPNVLKYTDHHLVLAFTNPAYEIGDYPLYQLTVTGTTGVAYTRTSETRMSPSVTVPWPKTAEDDSKTFLIRIRRISGQPNGNKYRLVLQAD